MKKSQIIFFTLFSLLFSLPVSAHVLKTDGNIGVTIHVNPDDDPIVGQPASFFLDIVDKENKFTLSECNCEIQIKKNGQQIFSTPFTSTVINYIFPEKNIYTIQINGNPKTPNAFQSFSINYDLRVAKDSYDANNSDNKFWIYIGIVIAIGIIAAVYLARRN